MRLESAAFSSIGIVLGSSLAAFATWPTVGWTLRVVLLAAASALIVAALLGVCFEVVLRRPGLPLSSKPPGDARDW
ncbi:MAG: hypothetical protein AB7O28_05770 [Vicinamibacterales bacterium]